MSRTPSNKLQLRRAALAGRQNWRCHWCGVEMLPVAGQPPHDSRTVTLDHLFPAFLVGRTSRTAKVLHAPAVAACLACNAKRGKIHNARKMAAEAAEFYRVRREVAA